MKHIHLSDRYQNGTSRIHRLDPRVKVIVTLLFIISNVIMPDGAWIAFALLFGLVTLGLRAGEYWHLLCAQTLVRRPPLRTGRRHGRVYDSGATACRVADWQRCADGDRCGIGALLSAS
jgi:hypothetical protein